MEKSEGSSREEAPPVAGFATVAAQKVWAALMTLAFPAFPDLPEDLQLLILGKTVVSQREHAYRHYRRHLNRPEVHAAAVAVSGKLTGVSPDCASDDDDDAPLDWDPESAYQAMLLDDLLGDTYVRRTDCLVHIEVGLSPIAQRRGGLPFDRNGRNDTRNTVIEYALDQGKWAAVLLWLNTCSDQLRVDLLEALHRQAKNFGTGYRAGMNRDLYGKIMARLHELRRRGWGYAPPVWKLGSAEADAFIAAQCGAENGGHLEVAGLVDKWATKGLGSTMCDTFSYFIDADKAVLFLSVAASEHSKGYATPQGLFSDLVGPLKDALYMTNLCAARGLRDIEAVGSEVGPDRRGSDSESEDPRDLDPLLWVAVSRGMNTLAKLMIELGARADQVHRDYKCDLVVFVRVLINHYLKNIDDCTLRGLDAPYKRRELALAELRQKSDELARWSAKAAGLAEFETWLLQRDGQCAQGWWEGVPRSSREHPLRLEPEKDDEFGGEWFPGMMTAANYSLLDADGSGCNSL